MSGSTFDDQREFAVRLIEMMKSRLQPGNEAAALGGKDEPNLLGRAPAAPLAAGRIEAMDLLLLDVDEPQGAVALDPHRPFAELRREIPDVGWSSSRSRLSASRRRRNIRGR